MNIYSYTPDKSSSIAASGRVTETQSPEYSVFPAQIQSPGYSLQNSSFLANSYQSQTSFELLQANKAHVEKDRIDLLVQLHEESEKNRVKKLQVDKLEAALKAAESSQAVVTRALEDAQENARVLKQERDYLELDVRKLKDQIDTNNSAASETRSLWTKMTAASRELSRLEEEAIKLRKDKIDILNEKDHLSNVCESLKESNEKQMEDMTMLRLEVEGQRKIFDDLKLSQKNEINMLKSQHLESVKALMTTIDIAETDKRGMSDKIQSLKDELSEMRRQMAHQMKELKSAGSITNNNEDSNIDQNDTKKVIEDLRRRLLESETKRKYLHNALQELRGNIRVYVRCRPFLSCDGEEANTSLLGGNSSDVSGCVRFYKDGSSLSVTGSSRNTAQIFSFDQVNMYQKYSTNNLRFHSIFLLHSMGYFVLNIYHCK